MNKNTKHYDMTIVVNTCDAYRDVLEIFFYAFQEYWPDCPYPLVINTEQNSYNYPATVHNYDSTRGLDDWGARLLSTLGDIHTEYVFVLYDDFILDAPLNNEHLVAAFNILQSNINAAVTYLINTKLPLCTQHDDNTFILLKDRVDYRLNSAPAIWRRKTLMSYTAAGDTPWAWEVFGTYRTWGDGKLFYSLNPDCNDIYSYNYDRGGAIYRGKWVRDVIEKIKDRYPLNIDWQIRGFSSDTVFEKRSIRWKLQFILIGFRMVGLKALNFLIGYVREKWHAN